MPACSFCKKMFKEPRGLSVFTFDGKAINFCSSKCRRNAELKRDPRKINWVRKSGVLISESAGDLSLEKETAKEEKKAG
ncbi:MAG: hypothetical protein PHF67_00345 [Candidatus Nanoarchaeia archaeon]|nr:hypothetical protein [Candidatus Nanoarchaeia archaeon]